MCNNFCKSFKYLNNLHVRKNLLRFILRLEVLALTSEERLNRSLNGVLESLNKMIAAQMGMKNHILGGKYIVFTKFYKLK